METALLDLRKRLWIIVLIFVVLLQGTAFFSRQIPDREFLRWHGITGQVLYEYPLGNIRKAYILHDAEKGVVSFAAVDGERLVDHQIFPYFKNMDYASEVRLSDLQLQRQLYMAVNQTSTDQTYYTAQHMFWVNHADLKVKYITRGVTREPERLEGQTVLFRTEIDGATVFCIESEDRPVLETP